VNSKAEKICTRCQAVFTCGAAEADESCWCARLPHVPLIADEGTDCFCPQCLEKVCGSPHEVRAFMRSGPDVGKMHLLRACFCSAVLRREEAVAKLNVPESGPTEVLNQQATLPLLKEGRDYYVEGGAMVFTAAYHLRRGYCCGSGCRHCPYDQKPVPARGISRPSGRAPNERPNEPASRSG